MKACAICLCYLCYFLCLYSSLGLLLTDTSGHLHKAYFQTSRNRSRREMNAHSAGVWQREQYNSLHHALQEANDYSHVLGNDVFRQWHMRNGQGHRRTSHRKGETVLSRLSLFLRIQNLPPFKVKFSMRCVQAPSCSLKQNTMIPSFPDTRWVTARRTVCLNRFHCTHLILHGSDIIYQLPDSTFWQFWCFQFLPTGSQVIKILWKWLSLSKRKAGLCGANGFPFWILGWVPSFLRKHWWLALVSFGGYDLTWTDSHRYSGESQNSSGPGMVNGFQPWKQLQINSGVWKYHTGKTFRPGLQWLPVPAWTWRPQRQHLGHTGVFSTL